MMASNVDISSGKLGTTIRTEESPKESNLMSDLRSQLNSMTMRVEELQRENEMLLSRIYSCQCSEYQIKYQEHLTSYSANSGGNYKGLKQNSKLLMDESTTNPSQSNSFEVSNKDEKHIFYVNKYLSCTSPEQTKQPGHHITKHEYAKRYVALKILYFGHRFYGFASEAQLEPTIESELFKALERTKLLVGTRQDSHYSRCGRTDKGVSSTGQVISLYLRSNGKCSGEEREINYVMVLNRVLPKDIRVIGSTTVSPEFSARFSCLSRKYLYLFWRGIMDISDMQQSAGKFIGEHDFRNFCKMDAVNVNNYRRHITEFSIHPYSKWSNDDLWAITIKGSAFLWHQVRCMVSVLFMIGEGLESPNVIDTLLDINKTTRKPQYTMASELPLMLHSCEFQGVNFKCSSDGTRNLENHLSSELRSCLLRSAMIEEALNCLKTLGVEEENSMERCKKKKGHIPLMLRPTEPSYEERRSKLAMKASYIIPA